MTREEFDLWLDDHSQAVFPGVDTWLRKMPPGKLLAVLREWWSILGNVPIEAAQKASRDLLAGKTDPPFGKHAIEVRRLAAKYTPKKTVDEFDGVGMPSPEQRLAATIAKWAKET